MERKKQKRDTFKKTELPSPRPVKTFEHSGKYMDDVTKCLDVLKAGGIILYPTETIWGIGCDATNEQAVKKIYELKHKQELQSLLVLVDHADRLGRYVKQIPEAAIQLIEVNDKPMTIIYPGAVNLASNIISPEGSIGIRITSDEFCKKLISSFNKPLVSTSANLSGEPYPETFRDIPESILKGVDYVVKWRQKDPNPGTPSSIIKVGSKGQIEIIRP